MRWWYEQNGQTKGPVENGELRSLVEQGTLDQTSRVIQEGASTWTTVEREASNIGIGSGGASGPPAAPSSGQVPRYTSAPAAEPPDASSQQPQGGYGPPPPEGSAYQQRSGEAFPAAHQYQTATALQPSPQWLAPAHGHPPLSSPGKRLGAYLLDNLLYIATLGIGWLIWSLIIWKDGYTPAKKLLGMRVVRLDTSQPATWGWMALRELIGKFVGGLAGVLTLGVLYFMLLWDDKNQQLWDKIAGTVVVEER